MLKKFLSIVCLLFSLLIILLNCLTNAASDNRGLATLGPESELTITPSDLQVSEFVEKIKDYELYNNFVINNDECYNITPDFIADNSDYTIFKYYKTAESFIMYNGEVYRAFRGFGGITSMALADLNCDGEYELYYTCDTGSGILGSEVFCIESTYKEAVPLYYICDYHMMLTVDESDNLIVNLASISYNNFPYNVVDFTIKAAKPIGTITFDGEKPIFNDESTESITASTKNENE